MAEQKSLKIMILENKKQLLFLFLLVFLVYANSLNNEFVSDDKDILMADFNDVSQVFSQPRTFLRALFYFITNLFFGKNPLFFRLPNIGFHLLAVGSIYLIVNFLKNKETALAVAAIFSVHPILIEAISWISGGGYSQYGMFFLLSFLFYILSSENKKYYYFSLIFFLMSLFSAEKSFILAGVFLAYQLGFEDFKKDWKKIMPYLILGLSLGLYYFTRIGERAELLETKFYHQVETKGIPLTYTLKNAATALFKYLELIFWPQHLTLYQSEVYTKPLLIFISFLVFGGLIALLIYGFFKNKYLFFGLSLFLISLLPFLTPFGITWWVAERYAYLGTFGIIFITVLFFEYLEKKYLRLKGVITALFLIIVILLSLRTIIRNNDWQNEDNLWVATARESPSDPKTHNNMGDYYGRHGNLEKSLNEFRIAIKLKPDYADAYHNLANTYYQIGQTALAIENYQKAIEFNPGLWQSYQNLAVIYFEQEKYELAKEQFETAIKINSQNSNLHYNLGVIYLKMDENELAREEFQKAQELEPGKPKPFLPR